MQPAYPSACTTAGLWSAPCVGLVSPSCSSAPRDCVAASSRRGGRAGANTWMPKSSWSPGWCLGRTKRGIGCPLLHDMSLAPTVLSISTCMCMCMWACVLECVGSEQMWQQGAARDASRLLQIGLQARAAMPVCPAITLHTDVTEKQVKGPDHTSLQLV